MATIRERMERQRKESEQEIEWQRRENTELKEYVAQAYYFTLNSKYPFFVNGWRLKGVVIVVISVHNPVTWPDVLSQKKTESGITFFDQRPYPISTAESARKKLSMIAPNLGPRSKAPLLYT